MSRSRRRRIHATLISILAVFTLGSSAAHGQSLWIPRNHDTVVLLEVFRPEFDDNLAIQEEPTGALFLDVRHAFASGTAIVAEVALSRFRGTFDTGGFFPFYRTETEFGNPYVGVEIGGDDTPVFGEVGVRLPVGSENQPGTLLTGIASDVTRWDAFVDDYVTVRGCFNLREKTDAGITARLRFGPVLFVPTESNLDTEAFGVFAWQIGYEGRALRAGSALSGIIHFSDPSGNLGSRARTQVELHADFGSWRIRPGLELKLPLGLDGYYVPLVLGLSVSAAL